MTYREEAIKLARDLQAQQGKIATHRDPNLSPEGLEQTRRDATKSLREAATGQAADLYKRTEARRFMARLAADTARPRVKEEPAALIRMQQKWDQTRALLESGRNIQAVIRTADLDTLLAIEEFAPTYLQSKAVRPTGIADVERRGPDGAPNLTLPIERRLVELSPGEVAQKLRTAHEAEEDAAAAQPYIDHVSQFGLHGQVTASLLDIGVAAHYAAAPFTEPTAEPEPAAQAESPAA